MVPLLLLINVAAAKQPLETKALPLKDASALEMVNSSKKPKSQLVNYVNSSISACIGIGKINIHMFSI
jgi:hypothetical protein